MIQIEMREEIFFCSQRSQEGSNRSKKWGNAEGMGIIMKVSGKERVEGFRGHQKY